MLRIFDFDKETKNTIRFQERFNQDGIAVGTLYIQKYILDDLGYQDGDSIEIDINIH